MLWRRIFLRDFKVALTFMPPHAHAVDWLAEYIRLFDTVPNVLAQTLTKHTDEVLHVTFSHDGKQIASCSKVKCCSSEFSVV